MPLRRSAAKAHANDWSACGSRRRAAVRQPPAPRRAIRNWSKSPGLLRVLNEGCLVTLVDLVSAALSGPDRPVLYERAANGRWNALGTADVLARVTAIAAALRARGLAPGDRVALLSPNRVDWILANLGILFAGGVTVPIYATQAADQVRFIVADSGARELFVDTQATAERLRAEGIALTPIVFDAAAEDEN